MTEEQLRDSISYLGRGIANIRNNLPGPGLYLMAFLAAIGTCDTCGHTDKLKAIEQKQSELETTCNSNGALHIKNVTGGEAEDVYLEADEKRFFLYVDGKAVTQQPDDSEVFPGEE